MTHRTAIEKFTDERPSLDSYSRALVLFGRNVASYKFALGQSLLELGAEERELVTLDELAVPFSRHVCRHLRAADRQGTSERSKFLDACRAHNASELSEDDLIETTRRLGFQNVIDAFHVLDGVEIDQRFFLDERSNHGGIRLTDQMHRLFEEAEPTSLTEETESRWQLVEAAWDLNLPRQLLTVSYDPDLQSLRTVGRRRTAVTGNRGALNGYQKGAWFYWHFGNERGWPGAEGIRILVSSTGFGGWLHL